MIASGRVVLDDEVRCVIEAAVAFSRLPPVWLRAATGPPLVAVLVQAKVNHTAYLGLNKD